ncbi:MAG: DUF6427 family protein [Bacteroidales bacterium]|nr:DUF6427 family protein [Bacteroidales bacterium]
MLKIFKGTGPGVILLIAATFLLLWIGAFTDPRVTSYAIFDARPMPLYGILRTLLGDSGLAGAFFSSAVLILILFLLVYFNTSVFFIGERTFLPAVIYILFSAIFPECQSLNPVLPAAVFLVLAIMRIMDSYRKQGVAYNFFDAGILLGIGSLFYAGLIWFGVIAIAGIVIIRTGSIREIAVTLAGLIAPYLITAGIFYLLDRDLLLFLSDIGKNLFGKAPDFEFTKLTVMILIFTGLILIVSVAYLVSGMNKKKIKAGMTFSILLWAFFLSLGVYFVLPSVSVEIVYITAVPASYILAHYLIFVRKRLVPEIIFSLFFLLVLLVQAFHLFGRVT